MTKILFIPFSAVGGLVAGVLGKQIFAVVWGLIDEERPPQPSDREASWQKVFVAQLLQGAIFKAVRGLVDRSMRSTFAKLTGAWPGDQRPQSS